MKFLEMWEKVTRDKEFLNNSEDKSINYILPSPFDSHTSAFLAASEQDKLTSFLKGFDLCIKLIQKYGIPEDIEEILTTYEEFCKKHIDNRESESPDNPPNNPTNPWDYPYFNQN